MSGVRPSNVHCIGKVPLAAEIWIAVPSSNKNTFQKRLTAHSCFDGCEPCEAGITLSLTGLTVARLRTSPSLSYKMKELSSKYKLLKHSRLRASESSHHAACNSCKRPWMQAQLCCTGKLIRTQKHANFGSRLLDLVDPTVCFPAQGTQQRHSLPAFRVQRHAGQGEYLYFMHKTLLC